METNRFGIFCKCHNILTVFTLIFASLIFSLPKLLTVVMEPNGGVVPRWRNPTNIFIKSLTELSGVFDSAIIFTIAVITVALLYQTTGRVVNATKIERSLVRVTIGCNALLLVSSVPILLFNVVANISWNRSDDYPMKFTASTTLARLVIEYPTNFVVFFLSDKNIRNLFLFKIGCKRKKIGTNRSFSTPSPPPRHRTSLKRLNEQVKGSSLQPLPSLPPRPRSAIKRVQRSQTVHECQFISQKSSPQIVYSTT